MPVPVTDLGPLLAAGITAPTTSLGPSTLPLALFPVRLETRIFTVGTMAEIRIRVYPDKVHINSHDPGLAAAEIDAGKTYWRAVWPLGVDDPAAVRAWAVLAGQYEPNRAAWIVRRLTPTNVAQRPAGQPTFPTVTATTTPLVPKLALLPDRWIATAYIGNALAATVTGKDIVSPLAIGPDMAAAVTVDDEHPAIDNGMRWMIDFSTAEQAGMALRLKVPLPGAVDLLLVTGVGHGDRAADVLAQLDAHHYTDGLAFLPPGTPTNNTEAGRTPFREPDPDHSASYATEIRPATIPTRSNAQLMSLALGFDAFGHTSGALDTDEVTAQAMATALWPATWGYFLSQMIGFNGTGLSNADRDLARLHTLTLVRAGGPLPAVRIGAQPYGVLPVTSMDRWLPRPGNTSFNRVRDVLVALREGVWRPASARVPRLGTTDDPSSDLANVLQTAALSSSFAVRRLMGQQFLEHLRAFLTSGPDAIPDYWPTLVQLAGAISSALGLGTSPALVHAVHEELTHRVITPLVGDPAYIAELLAASDVDALAVQGPAALDPVLKVLLRHGLLRAYADGAARLLNQASTPAEQLLPDPEMVDLVPGQAPAHTWQRQRDSLVPGTTTTVRTRLAQAPVFDVTDVRAALQTLATVDAPTLERHLCNTLDTTSHRLDAWVTSLATLRLAEQRVLRSTGLAVGGYGWVQNLRPRPAGEPVAALPGEPGPLTAAVDDPGFIHAPSLNQAGAAALLRTAHLAHGGTPDSPFAIELTSGRIRLVRQLFEGVRQGQPLGAMLGYTLERRLHDAALDDLIDPLRNLAPLPGAATPTGVRRLVVDGLALSAIWQADRDTVLNLLPATDSRRPAAARVLDGLADAVDAASDAVQAEAAFQMARGNMSRAATSLDAIASGQTPPPDLGFLKTPRTGVGVTHRVAMLVPAGSGSPGAGWATSTVRATADPGLNQWAGRLLGPAQGVTARVEELDDSGTVTATRVIALPALGLAPIDLVWATAGADGAPSEIIQRILAAAPPTTARQRVNLGRTGAGRSLGDLIEVAGSARRLLAGARSMDGADLQAPHLDPVRGLNLTEFEARAVAAEQALSAARAALNAALTGGTNLRAPMLTVAAFGIPGAVPIGDATLVPQAKALLAELDRRLAPPATTSPVDDAAQRDAILARLRAVFGPGFLALPRFTASNANDLTASLADAAALHGSDPLGAYTWLLRMERVRPALARFGRTLRDAEALGTGESLNVSLAQVPHTAGQRWLGLPLAPGTTPVDGVASLVLQSVPNDVHGVLCGIVADEWTELIPSRNETTGVAFQYDPPDAMAPQAILLAVPPVIGAQWTTGMLNRILMETLDQARLRGAGFEALGDITQFVPATYLAFNLSGDAVSSDLTALIGS